MRTSARGIHLRGLLLLSALLGACAHESASPPPPVRRPPRLVVDTKPPPPGACKLPPPGTSPANGAQPAPSASGGLELLRIDGDARFEMDGAFAVGWSSDGAVLATATHKGLLLWDMEHGTLRRTVPLPPGHAVHELLVNADATWAVLQGGLHGQSVLSFVRLDGTPGIYSSLESPYRMRLTRDGRRLVTRYTSGQHDVWDLDTKTRTLLPARRSALTVLGDGVHYVTEEFIGEQRQLVVQEVVSGRVLRRLPPRDLPHEFAAEAPRIGYLDARGLEVLDVLTGQRVHHLTAVRRRSGGLPLRFVLSPDGDLAAVWHTERMETNIGVMNDYDESHLTAADREDVGVVSVWSLKTGQRLWRLHRSTDTWRFSTDGQWLLGGLGAYEATTGTPMPSTRQELPTTRSPPDSRFVFNRDDWELPPQSWYRPTPGSPPRLSPKRTGRVVARSADGNWVASLDADRRLQLEGPAGCTGLGVSITEDKDAVAFSPDGALLYATSGALSTSSVYVWRTETAEPLRVLGSPDGWAHPLPEAGRVALMVGPPTDTLYVLDVQSGAEVTRVQPPPAPRKDAYELKRERGDRPDELSREPVASTRDGRFLVNRSRIYRPRTDFRWDPRTARFADMTLVRRDSNHLVSIWDLENPAAPLDVQVESSVNVFTLSPDERTVAAGLHDGRVALVSRDTSPHRVLGGLKTGIAALAFTPDGRHLAAADMAGDVLITNLEQGTEAGRLHLPFDHALHLWFSPDGGELRVDTERGLRLSTRFAPAPPLR